MSFSENLDNLRQLMLNTPLLKEDLKEIVDKRHQNGIKENINFVSALLQNAETPLNIVIMGEVKAGKSTLVNAIIGAEISPADLLETTSAIIEIGYSPTPFGVIMKDGKELARGDAEKIYAILDFNRGNKEYFKGSVTVKFTLPLLSLKEFHLVDTPGVLSVTPENSALAKEYVKNADLVFWVLNAHHLGQTDILSELSDVAHLGKPVIGIINRIDQIDGSVERLKEHAQKEMGIYLKDIFTLSAKKAWQGTRDNNQRLIHESGLEDLLTYVRDDIGSRAQEVKNDSIRSTLSAIFERYTLIHENFLQNLSLLLNETGVYENELELKAKEIENKIESYLRVQVYETLFEDELVKLEEQIQALSSASSSEKKATLIQEINSSFGPQVINEWWRETEQVVSAMYKSEWWEAAKDIHDSKLRMLDEFDRVERFAVTGNLKKTELNVETAAVDGLGQGLFIGTALALGLASYSALLGPAATYLTLGAALTTFIPPLAIAGSLTGMLSKAWQADRDRREFLVKIRNRVTKARDELWSDVIEKRVLPNIHQNSERTIRMLKDAYLLQVSKGLSLERLDLLERDLEIHLDDLERQGQLLGIIRTQDIVNRIEEEAEQDKNEHEASDSVDKLE